MREEKDKGVLRTFRRWDSWPAVFCSAVRDQLYQSGREQSLGARASRWLHSADWLQAPGGDGGGSLAGTLYIGVTQAQRDKVGARAVDCIGLACKIRIIRFFFFIPLFPSSPLSSTSSHGAIWFHPRIGSPASRWCRLKLQKTKWI